MQSDQRVAAAAHGRADLRVVRGGEREGGVAAEGRSIGGDKEPAMNHDLILHCSSTLYQHSPKARAQRGDSPLARLALCVRKQLPALLGLPLAQVVVQFLVELALPLLPPLDLLVVPHFGSHRGGFGKASCFCFGEDEGPHILVVAFELSAQRRLVLDVAKNLFLLLADE